MAWASAWALLPGRVGEGSPAARPRRAVGRSLEAAAAPEWGQWSLLKRQKPEEEEVISTIVSLSTLTLQGLLTRHPRAAQRSGTQCTVLSER